MKKKHSIAKSNPSPVSYSADLAVKSGINLILIDLVIPLNGEIIDIDAETGALMKVADSVICRDHKGELVRFARMKVGPS